MPEKPHNFWQELKRRKVIRVIAMYAGAAYVIIELSTNIVEPLKLPEWTPTMIIVLLIVGFPFAIIFSWIFDVTPEGIKKTKSVEITQETTSKTGKRKVKVSDIIIAILLIAVIVLVYPKIFKKDSLEELKTSGERIAVTVMPFQNLTNDTTKNYCEKGIQTLITNILSNNNEILVRQTDVINSILQGKEITYYASLTPSVASTISKMLNADIVITGNIIPAGLNVRLTAQVINSNTTEVLKPFQIEGLNKEGDIIEMTDSLSIMIRDYLIFSILKKDVPPLFEGITGSTDSPDALRNYIEGMNEFGKRDFPAARERLLAAIAIDSNFLTAYSPLAASYGNQGIYDQAKKWSLKAYEKRDMLPKIERLMVEYTHAIYFGTPTEELKYLRQMNEIDDQSTMVFYSIGNAYRDIYQYEKAISAYERSLEIQKKWEIKPFWVLGYTFLGSAYHKTGQYRKERKLYKKAEKDFPGDPALLHRQAVLALSTGKNREADEYIEQYVSVRKEGLASDAIIASWLGSIYGDAQILDKAEEYYRQSLSMEPESAWLQNNLAYFLIDKEINISEGLQLVDKVLESEPENYLYLDTKGWGLYKQGNYQEALEVLERSWKLKPVYDHDVYLHLEAAKKAAGSQKN